MNLAGTTNSFYSAKYGETGTLYPSTQVNKFVKISIAAFLEITFIPFANLLKIAVVITSPSE